MDDKQLNIGRAEELIAGLLYKLLSEDMINQEDINKAIDYIYSEEITS